jgi:pimeloyl-ACP methyl ester carboxylesterase
MTTDPTQRTLQPYPDLPLTVTDSGHGRPVLVLHGGAGPASMTALVQHLATACRVLTPTHPGWDATPRPEWFAGVSLLTETYLDLLAEFDLRDVLVIGNSFGGWVASELTLRDRGRRISQLVLIDAIGPEIPGQRVQAPTSGPGPSPENMAALRVYAGSAMADPALLHRLGQVKLPTLLVWGEHDTVVTPDFGRAYAAAFANAWFVVIPDAGHIPMREAPAATFAVIDGFSLKDAPE